jgi:prepilin-type N-terminal cleavage/methylation domain-containing protein
MAGNKSGMTIIEMLVVIVIILALMGMVLVSVYALKKKAKIKQAELQCVSLEAAIGAYFNEYGRYPISSSDNASSSSIDYTEGNYDNVITYMLVSSTTKDKNPRGILFIKPNDYDQAEENKPSVYKTGDFLDPWGQPFKFHFPTGGSSGDPLSGVYVAHSKD